MTAQHVLILDLKDDPQLIVAYEKYHAPGGVPPAILESIRASGVEEMEIYRCGNRLVMLMTTSPRFDPAAKASADAADSDVIAWEALMDQFQQRLPWAPADVKWMEAARIFALSEHSGAEPGTEASCNDNS